VLAGLRKWGRSRPLVQGWGRVPDPNLYGSPHTGQRGSRGGCLLLTFAEPHETVLRAEEVIPGDTPPLVRLPRPVVMLWPAFQPATRARAASGTMDTKASAIVRTQDSVPIFVERSGRGKLRADSRLAMPPHLQGDSASSRVDASTNSLRAATLERASPSTINIGMAERTGVQVLHFCPRHGVIATASIPTLGPEPSRRCPVCHTTTETWVGPSSTERK
jgi:hypothetical protein